MYPSPPAFAKLEEFLCRVLSDDQDRFCCECPPKPATAAAATVVMDKKSRFESRKVSFLESGSGTSLNADEDIKTEWLPRAFKPNRLQSADVYHKNKASVSA